MGINRMTRDALAPMKVSSAAKATIETRAHPRRRKIPTAVQIPQALKAMRIAAITLPIAARGNGGAAGPVGGGFTTVPNRIKPAKVSVSRLPTIVRPALVRIPIQYLCMIAEQSICL
jgi:hypothetical protein